MAESDAVQWRVTDHIGRIALNRPDAGNAIDRDLAHGFRAAVNAMSSADIGAVLVSANENGSASTEISMRSRALPTRWVT